MNIYIYVLGKGISMISWASLMISFLAAIFAFISLYLTYLKKTEQFYIFLLLNFFRLVGL
jgi:hypothetical protein